MASEIRANKQTNRVGLGTVTYTDTGIIVSGIVTANSFKGDGSSLTGIDATALKDGSGNTKVQASQSGAVHSGISTFNEIKLGDGKYLRFGNDSDLDIRHTGSTGNIYFNNGSFNIRPSNANHASPLGLFGGTELYLKHIASNGTQTFCLNSSRHGSTDLYYAGTKKFETSNTGVTITGTVSATAFTGDGSSLSNLPAGAPVGGATTNTVFFENDKAVAVNYQITSTKNAMSAGPIAINAGIAVTVPSGCSWTIV